MIELLHPVVRAKAEQLVTLAAGRGVRIKLTEGYRPPERQQALLDAKKTQAKPWWSFHQHGLAFDWVPLDPQGRAWWEAPLSVWQTVGQVGESLGLTWGGRWRTPDKPHFEYHPGFTIQDLLARGKAVGALLAARPAVPAMVLLLLALGAAAVLTRRQV